MQLLHGVSCLLLHNTPDTKFLGVSPPPPPPPPLLLLLSSSSFSTPPPPSPSPQVNGSIKHMYMLRELWISDTSIRQVEPVIPI